MPAMRMIVLGIVSSSASASSSANHAALPSYALVPIAGDGRCLFRSVHVSRQMSQGARSNADVHDDDAKAADALRAAAVNELRRRRDELAWAVEGNFDSYLERMSNPH